MNYLKVEENRLFENGGILDDLTDSTNFKFDNDFAKENEENILNKFIPVLNKAKEIDCIKKDRNVLKSYKSSKIIN